MELGEPGGAVFLLGRQAVAGVVEDRHAEAAGAAGHRLADSAHAQQSQRLAGDADAQQVPLADAVPPAGAHQRVILVGTAGGGQEQPEGEIGGAIVQHARGVGDDHPGGAGGGDVDMIEADRAGGADAQPGRQSGDGGGVEAEGVGEQDRLRFVGLGGGDRLGRGHVVGAAVDQGVELGGGAGGDGVGQQRRDQEAGFGHGGSGG